MNMQQMLAQAQKMQRELQKAQEELKQKEFTVSKGGAVTIVVLGDKTIKSVSIDKDAFDPENKEMVEEMVAMAVNEAHQKIDAEEAKINETIIREISGR